MAPEVAEAFPVLYLTQLPRKMYSQPIVHKALSWSTIRKAVCILAAITIRKSQLLTLLVFTRIPAVVEDICWCVWHRNALVATAFSVGDWQSVSIHP